MAGEHEGCEEAGKALAVLQRESFAGTCLICREEFESLMPISMHVGATGHTVEYVERGAIMPLEEVPPSERN